MNSSSHLVIRGIKFTRGSHGIRLMNSDFISIEACEIFETGDAAISANVGGTHKRSIILRNHIHHTNGIGQDIYLGCKGNACRVADSLIEANIIHHINRDSIVQGDGIEIKEGSCGEVIRDNVIERNVIWTANENTLQTGLRALGALNATCKKTDVNCTSSGYSELQSA